MRCLPTLTCLLGLLLAAPSVAEDVEQGVVSGAVSGAVSDAAPEASDGRIYRMTDSQGRVIFTDSPPPGAAAEEVRQSRPNSMPAPPRRRAEDRHVSEPQPGGFIGYTAMAISAPANDQTFQNPQEPIGVQVSLTPGLQSGHRLQVLHNGEPLEGTALIQPVRGAHALKAQVLDADGRVLKESDTVTIHVHRPSVLLGPGARRNAPEKEADKKGSGLVQILPWFPASR